jgi:hypothetical protein
MSKKLTTAQIEAKERLLRWLPPGQTIYTIVRSVSRSGMSRHIQLVYFELQPSIETDEFGTSLPPTISDRHPTHSVAILLGHNPSPNKPHDTIRVDGCGMDMCWHLVNEQLSYALYGKPGVFNQRTI